MKFSTRVNRCNHKSQAVNFKGNNTSKHQDLISSKTKIKAKARNSIENNINWEHSSINQSLSADSIWITLYSNLSNANGNKINQEFSSNNQSLLVDSI